MSAVEISASAVMKLREETGAGMMECKKALTEAGGDAAKAVEILRERGLKKSAEKQSRVANEGTVLSSVNDARNFAVMVEINCETDFVAKNDDFVKFSNNVLAQVRDSKPANLDAFLSAPAAFAAGQTIADAVTGLTAKIGEKIAVKRIAVIENNQGVIAGYIHPGNKLGVLLQLNVEGFAATMTADAYSVAYDIAMQTAAMNPTYIHREEVPADVVEKESAILREQLKNDPKNANKPDNVLTNIIKGRLDKFYQEVCLVDQAFVKDPNKMIKDLVADLSKKLGKPVTIRRFERFRLGE